MQRLRREEAEVGVHADRDEEEPEQESLERLDVGLELVPIFAVGEQHAGDERAERHGQADHIEQQRGADDDEQGRGREGFLRSRVGHEPQGGAQQIAPEQDRAHDRGDRTADRLPRQLALSACREQRQNEQRGHDREVLEQQHGERAAAVACVEFAALGQHLQDQRGRRQRQREADDERGRPRLTEQPCRAGDRKRGQQYLCGSHAEHGMSHDPEARRLQLEPDHEQQQHDAELGEMQDVLDVVEEGQAPGTDHERPRRCTRAPHSA